MTEILRSEEGLSALWERWTMGRDIAARDALVAHYLPLVRSVSARFWNRVDRSGRGDLFGFGVIGLMDALDKFRPELGSRFESYCPFRIRGAIQDGLRQMAWFPRDAHKRAGRAMTSVAPVDFHAPRGESGLPLHETLRDVLEGAVGDGLVLESEHEEVTFAIDGLPERERLVVVQHYYRDRRLKDIGSDLGVTESRACQLHRRALSRLQQALAPAAA